MDEIKILEAKVSRYIITARKKNNDWYIGGMTDWTSREFTLPLDFIDEENYTSELCMDGVNADSYASDYVIKKFIFRKGEPLKIKMAQGGGFLLRLIKQKN